MFLRSTAVLLAARRATGSSGSKRAVALGGSCGKAAATKRPSSPSQRRKVEQPLQTPAKKSRSSSTAAGRQKAATKNRDHTTGVPISRKGTTRSSSDEQRQQRQGVSSTASQNKSDEMGDGTTAALSRSRRFVPFWKKEEDGSITNIYDTTMTAPTGPKAVQQGDRSGEGEAEKERVDAYFGSGSIRDPNPMYADRKRARRAREAQEADELDDAIDSHDENIAAARGDGDGSPQQNAAVESSFEAAKDRDSLLCSFLPYGAEVSEVDAEGMAVWGNYRANVLKAKSAFSDDHAVAMLVNDASEKLPHKYDGPVEKKKKVEGKKDHVAEDATTKETSESRHIDGGHIAEWPHHGTIGLVLDYDGVVVRGPRNIAGAADALHQLQKMKIPFVFLTNGSGTTEKQKAVDINDRLARCAPSIEPITPYQVVLAHSPMRMLAPRFQDKYVLVVGGADCLFAARQQGFTKAVHTDDVLARFPELVPLRWRGALKQYKPQPVTTAAEEPAWITEGFGAILVMDDPLDALSDAQLIIDVLTAKDGKLGLASHGASISRHQSVPLYYCSDDLLFAGQSMLPRLGNGAVREMISAAYTAVTGNPLDSVIYGKPRRIAMAYAELMLKRESKRQGHDPHDLRCIAMIGDNLETDIKGANAMGGKWLSVHVQSGIGSAPSATRTYHHDDEEAEFLDNVPTLPHYVAPTIDHFVRELQHLPEQVVTMNKQPVQGQHGTYGRLNPVDLAGLYNFAPFE